MKKTFLQIVLTCLILITNLFLFSACAPSSSGGGGGGGGGDASPPSTPPANVIGTAGGTYTLNNYEVVVPSGALDSEITVTITPIDQNNLPVTSPSNSISFLGCAEFLPDGTQFNSDVAITIPLGSPLTPGTTYDLFVYNTGTDSWDDTSIDGTVDAGGLTVSVSTDHFSIYALFRTDTTAPTVSAQNPAANAVDVARNASVEFEIDDSESNVALNTINVTVRGGAAIVGGALQNGYGGSVTADGSGGYDISIIPPDNFTYGDLISVIVDASDEFSNAFDQLTYSFTVIEDNSLPYTSGHDPAKNAVDVDPGTSIVVHVLDDEMGVNQASIIMTVEGATVSPAITGLEADFTLTYTPPSDFNYDQVVDVTIDASDNNNNPLTQDVYVFTIMAEPDSTAPFTSGHNPANGAINVAPITDIVVHVQDDGDGVNQSTIIMRVESSTVSPVITGLEADYTLTYNPPSAFNYGQVVDVTVDATDNNGNAMIQDAYSFTCIAVPDNDAPEVSAQNPAANATDVARNTNIYFEVNDTGTGVKLSSLSLLVEGETAVGSGGLLGSFGGSVVSDGAGGYNVTIIAAGNYDYSQVVDVVINVTDNNNNAMTQVSYSFTCVADNTAPYTASHNPAKGASDVARTTDIVVHVLDDGVGVKQSTIVMTVESSTVSPVITGTEADFTLTYTPPSDFGYGQVVDVTIDASDNSLNPLTQDVYSFTCVADTTPPAVSGQIPVANATDVARVTNVSFEIDDTETGVGLSTLDVLIGGAVAVLSGGIQNNFSGSVTADGSGGYDLTINPGDDFSYGQVVDVLVNATDLAISPNSMTQVNYSFTCVLSGIEAADSLNQERHYHTASLLNDGKVLVVGGYRSGYLSNCELYDKDTDSWDTTGSLSGARYGHSVNKFSDGNVLVVGGYNGSDYLASCELYDSGSGAWSAADSLSQKRRYHSAVTLGNGNILAIGGYAGGSNYLTSCELYDSTTDNWSVADSLNQARERFSSIMLLDGLVLAIGGYDGTDYLASCELYDSTADSWDTTGSLVQARYYHTTTLLNDGRVLVTGGHDGANYLASCELYDPELGTWSNTDTLEQARRWHTATLLNNGQVLVTGGYYTGGQYLTGSELYDPDTNTWSTTNSLNQGRSDHTATRLTNGQVLVVGGFESSYLSSSELYVYSIADDTTEPLVSDQIPPPSQTGIAVDSDVRFVISDQLPTDGSFYGVDITTITVTVAGNNAIVDGEFQANYSGEIIPDGIGGIYVTIDPLNNFSSGQNVTVTVDCEDMASTPNTMTKETYSFTCTN